MQGRAISKEALRAIPKMSGDDAMGEVLFHDELQKPDPIPAILDVEASGFGRGSYPIEIGFVLADQRSHCMLIKPHPQWIRWDASAEHLHGIQRAQLQQFGVDIKTVALLLNETLRGMTLYSDAWGNDQTWLALLFDCADIVPAFKLQTLRALLSDTQLALWQSTKQAVIRELALGRHRASNDARILQLTYLRTREMAGEKPAFRKLA